MSRIDIAFESVYRAPPKTACRCIKYSKTRTPFWIRCIRALKFIIYNLLYMLRCQLPASSYVGLNVSRHSFLVSQLLCILTV